MLSPQITSNWISKIINNKPISKQKNKTISYIPTYDYNYSLVLFFLWLVKLERFIIF